MYTALDVCCRVNAQRARLVGAETLRAAVACKVALLEDLDEFVFTVALDRARVADACGLEGVGGARRWGSTGKAGEDVLSKRSKRLGAGVYALRGVAGSAHARGGTMEHVQIGDSRMALPRGRLLQAASECE